MKLFAVFQPVRLIKALFFIFNPQLYSLNIWFYSENPLIPLYVSIYTKFFLIFQGFDQGWIFHF